VTFVFFGVSLQNSRMRLLSFALLSLMLAAAGCTREDEDKPPQEPGGGSDAGSTSGTLRLFSIEGPVTVAAVGDRTVSAPPLGDAWHLSLPPREFSASAIAQGASGTASFKLERTGNQVKITASTQAASPERSAPATAAVAFHPSICFDGGQGGRVRVTFDCTGTVSQDGTSLAHITVLRHGQQHCFTTADESGTRGWESADGMVAEAEGNCLRDIEISLAAVADEANAGSGNAQAVITLNIERL
jgi:hypothetical protein